MSQSHRRSATRAGRPPTFVTNLTPQQLAGYALEIALARIIPAERRRGRRTKNPAVV